MVMAGLGSLQGTFEFIDTDSVEIMNSGEHFMASEVEWDPTGRIVTTAVSYMKFKSDTGYYVWTFQGKLIQKNSMEKFYQLLWRPRPKTLLSAKQISAAKKNYKKYQTQFEAEDKMKENRASDEVLQRRGELNKAWQEFLERSAANLAARAEQLAALRPAVGDDEVEIEETVEIFVREDVQMFDGVRT